MMSNLEVDLLLDLTLAYVACMHQCDALAHVCLHVLNVSVACSRSLIITMTLIYSAHVQFL